MKSTTNRIQRAYMLAKANLGALEDIEKEIERKYIADHNITNAGGEVPERIYCIDDESVFDKANSECSDMPESKANFADILEARELLEQAENALIAYGLSIAPAREREILTRSAETNYTIRRKIIDLVLRLDASTVRA